MRNVIVYIFSRYFSYEQFFSFRKMFLVAAIVVYKKQQKVKIDLGPPGPLTSFKNTYRTITMTVSHPHTPYLRGNEPYCNNTSPLFQYFFSLFYSLSDCITLNKLCQKVGHLVTRCIFSDKQCWRVSWDSLVLVSHCYLTSGNQTLAENHH